MRLQNCSFDAKMLRFITVAVFYQWWYNVFVPGKYWQPRVIIENKARAQRGGADLGKPLYWKAQGPTLHKARLKMPAREKQSGLFVQKINDDHVIQFYDHWHTWG
jgi:hypothetical protein